MWLLLRIVVVCIKCMGFSQRKVLMSFLILCYRRHGKDIIAAITKKKKE